MSATIAKPELVKLPAGANSPGGQRGEQGPWGPHSDTWALVGARDIPACTLLGRRT